jgi:hypothetical protein
VASDLERSINTVTVTKVSLVLFMIVAGFLHGHVEENQFISFVPEQVTNDDNSLHYGYQGVMIGASKAF